MFPPGFQRISDVRHCSRAIANPSPQKIQPAIQRREVPPIIGVIHMASLIRDKKTGCKMIQLNQREGNGKRFKMSLGRVTVKDGELITSKLEAM